MADSLPIRIKICGVTSPVDAYAACASGATHIGLNFHPKSPRSVNLEQARAILATLPPQLTPVAVCVDHAEHEILALAHTLGIAWVQLHGDHPFEAVTPLRAAGLNIILARRIPDPNAVEALAAALVAISHRDLLPDALLVDAHVPGQPGGTGVSLTDAILNRLARFSWAPALDTPPLPGRLPPLILAGGLNPANIADRLQRIRPAMVDAASGVESAPGRKDPDLIQAFCAAVRSA